MHSMKKMLCLFLILWWPLFAMAAQRMQLEMQIASSPIGTQNANEQAETHQAATGACHHHSVAMTEAEYLDVKDSGIVGSHLGGHGLIHTCKMCGYCAVLAGFSDFTAFPNVIGFASVVVKPVLPTLFFHSQSYPPAIKPPISA